MLRLTAFPTSSQVVAAVLILAAVLALVLAQAVRAAGEAITPDSDTLTITEGAQGVYKVALAGDAPASDVMVTITPDNSDVTVNPSTLIFLPTNHTVPQNVVVTVGQDSDAIDERATLTHSVSGDVYDDAEVSVSITDDDEIGITLSETSLAVYESADNPTTDEVETDANQATYMVTVQAAPETEMTITVAADPDGKVTLAPDPATLRFTTDAVYPNVQTITVTVAEDRTTHDESVTLTHTVTGGSTAYRALSGQTVAVTVIDDDEAGVTLTPTELTLTEGGDAGTYTVELNFEPT